MMVNPRKMMKTRNNSEWKHQQKSYQNKGEFHQNCLKPQKPGYLEILERLEAAEQTNRMAELENFLSSLQRDPNPDADVYYYSGGQVNLTHFVNKQFKTKMNKVVEETAGLGEKVASNSLILKEILSHLDFSSLQSARLVSREWKILSNSELGKRNCCRKRFEREFLLNEDFDLEVLRNSLDLSWMEFDLENLNETELEYILTFCAGQIKSLSAHPSIFLLRLLEAGEFPNLKSLNFKEGGISASTTTTVKNPLEREFRNLLKFLRADSNSTSDEANPKLELHRLVIEHQVFEANPEFLKQIHRILDSSQKSLKFLKIPSALCSSFQLALELSGPFSQLSTLHFHINAQEKSQIPEFQFELPKIFVQGNLPNLKTVGFGFDARGGFSLQGFRFPSPQNTKIQKLSSVINLEFGSHCYFSLKYSLPSQWFPWLSASFPNVENLALSNLKNENEILLHAFTVWPNLVTLKIQSYPYFFSTEFYLDPVLTGLSPEKCEQLRRSQKPLPMPQTIWEKKTWPNLNSLKGLKRLDIITELPVPVSKISFLYAFDLNPELKVVVLRRPKMKYCDCLSRYFQRRSFFHD